MTPPIRHDGPCGLREKCWRQECRERYQDLPTIEKLPRDGLVLAYCHRARIVTFGLPIEQASAS